MSSITHADNTDPFRSLSQDEVDAVAGGAKSVAGTGGTNCFPIIVDDGHGGIVIISPTTGRFPR